MTLTAFDQLRAYWWNAYGKNPGVTVKLRDLRPRNFAAQTNELLARLAKARKDYEEKLGRWHGQTTLYT